MTKLGLVAVLCLLIAACGESAWEANDRNDKEQRLRWLEQQESQRSANPCGEPAGRAALAEGERT